VDARVHAPSRVGATMSARGRSEDIVRMSGGNQTGFFIPTALCFSLFLFPFMSVCVYACMCAYVDKKVPPFYESEMNMNMKLLR